MQRLEGIERDLAMRQNTYESAARNFYTYKREVEHERARALLSAPQTSVTEKKAHAELEAYDVEGAGHEAEYEALKAVIRVLETRATICQSLLRSHGRA